MKSRFDFLLEQISLCAPLNQSTEAWLWDELRFNEEEGYLTAREAALVEQALRNEQYRFGCSCSRGGNAQFCECQGD